MEQHTYEAGDFIVGCNSKSDCIQILWKGYIQVRATRRDTDKKTSTDLWFDTIEKGTCFNVYSAWHKELTSLLNFVANSKYCVVYSIKVSDILELAKTDF
jgi:hypothetical protein